MKLPSWEGSMRKWCIIHQANSPSLLSCAHCNYQEHADSGFLPPHPLPRLLSSLLPFPGTAWHWQLPEKLGTDSIVTGYASGLHMPLGQGSPWECSSLFLSIKEVFSDGRGAEGSASSGVGVQQSREWGQLVFFMLGWALVQGRTSLGGEADRR